MMGDWHWGGSAGWIGLLFMLLFWAVVIVGVVLLVRALSGQGRDRAGDAQVRTGQPDAAHRPTALDVLEERYARGEIDREEFLARKADLTG